MLNEWGYRQKPREKTQGFLNKAQTNWCEIKWKQMKNISCQLQAQQAG